MTNKDVHITEGRNRFKRLERIILFLLALNLVLGVIDHRKKVVEKDLTASEQVDEEILLNSAYDPNE